MNEFFIGVLVGFVMGFYVARKYKIIISLGDGA